MRNVLLNRLRKEESEFLFMVGDVGYRVIEDFQSEQPEKFLNTGVNEQLMASFASGVAKSKPCFIYSIANFSTLRCLEQIRNDICLHNAPVCIVSVGGGFGYGALGESHHNLEDVACLGSLPNISVLNPSSEEEVILSVDYFFKEKKPVYLRLSSLDKSCETINTQTRNIYSNEFISNKDSDSLILASGAVLSRLKKSIMDLKLSKSLDLFSICNLSDETMKKIDIKKYKRIFSFDEMVYSGSIASLMHKYLHTNNINPHYESYYIANYYNIPGGDSNYYRNFFGMSDEQISLFLKKNFVNR